MSKIKYLIGTLAVAGFAFAMSASAACDLGTATLKNGSTGTYVATLQSIVGVTADGSFGPMTAAAVKAWQTSHGLTADGVAGPITRAAMSASCATTETVSTSTETSTTTTTTTTVSGGAGDLTISGTSKNVESDVKEGNEEKVLGFKVEAEDSDIEITNVKVFLQNDWTDDATSEKLTKYVDEVKVYLGDEEVGTIDASEFSKESGTPDTFEKSIALSDAIIPEGNTEYLYISVVATDSIDTENETAAWNIAVSTLRYVDGTGAIMTADTGDTTFTGSNDDISAVDGNSGNFGFDAEDTDDSLKLKSSTSNPDDSTIGVDQDDETADVLVGAFKMEVDEDSADITINEIPVAVTFADNGTSADNFAEDVVKELYITIDGEEYSADLDDSDDATTNGSGTATYYVDLSDEDVVIEADDTVEVKIYATFQSMDDGDSYAEGTTVAFAVDADSIDAEGSDELASDQLDGSYSEPTLTLSSVDIEVSKSTSSVTYTDDDDHSLVEYTLEISIANNGDDDIYVPFGAAVSDDVADEGLGFILETTSGTEFAYSSASVEAAVEADDGDIEQDNAFLIESGEEQVIILTVTVDNATATAGYYRLTLKDLQYGYDDSTSDLSALSDDLTSIRTATKYITQ